MRGSRGAYGTGLDLVPRWVAAGHRALSVAGVTLSDMDYQFACQVWYLGTWTITLCGRRGTYGSGLELVMHWARLGSGWAPHTLRGRLGTF